MKSIHLILVAAGCALAVSVQAAGIADKLEPLSEMTYLKMTEMRVDKHDGLLTVQADITNSDNANQNMYYRIKWLDESGLSVWGEEAWKPVLIYGKQRKMINAVAPTPRATDFRIEVAASAAN